MTREQELYADLRQVADAVFAGGYTDEDAREQCDLINLRFGITNAYQRAEIIYFQQYG